jgi:hypothetical protein
MLNITRISGFVPQSAASAGDGYFVSVGDEIEAEDDNILRYAGITTFPDTSLGWSCRELVD